MPPARSWRSRSASAPSRWAWCAARRHDNRRHLLVLERAIRFDSTVKWVQAAATCRGACRLERLALLAVVPARELIRSHDRSPGSGRREWRGRRRGLRGTQLPCTASPIPPARLEVTAHTYTGAAPVRAAEEGRSTLHALALPALAAGSTPGRSA